jgi:VWD domain-containing protein
VPSAVPPSHAAGSQRKLVLHDARAFSGTITGFTAGDRLQLGGVHGTGASWSDGVLTVDTEFGGPIRLKLAGSYSSNFFRVQSDGLGGTLITGGGQGDVHMLCFDGLAYDFQAVGDFVAVQSNGGTPWQFQIRTESFPGATSITTGLAAMVGEARVTFAIGRGTLVQVDGAADTLQVGGVQGFGDGALARLSANVYRLSWNSGRSVTVTDQGDFLDWTVSLGAQDGPGSVKGLLGSNSGRDTDFQMPDGTVLHHPSDADLLGVFANAWRVQPGSSLLDDPPHPAILAQAMAANLVPADGASVGPGLPQQDANAPTLLAPSPLHG